MKIDLPEQLIDDLQKAYWEKNAQLKSNIAIQKVLEIVNETSKEAKKPQLPKLPKLQYVSTIQYAKDHLLAREVGNLYTKLNEIIEYLLSKEDEAV